MVRFFTLRLNSDRIARGMNSQLLEIGITGDMNCSQVLETGTLNYWSVKSPARLLEIGNAPLPGDIPSSPTTAVRASVGRGDEGASSACAARPRSGDEAQK